MARIRRWLTLLATDETAPPWTPTLKASTPEPLRRAAQWLVDRGHAPGLDHGMVCILLAFYVVERAGTPGDELEGELVPRDAA